MSLYTEPNYPGDVFLVEEEDNFSRETITVLSGTPAMVVGTILGKITTSVLATSAAKSGGNTGNGTCVVDVTTPVLTGATPGVYQVRMISATQFVLIGPLGNDLGVGTNGTAFSSRLKFVITAGGTAFIIGDGFDITVTAGSGKWTKLTLAAVNGSQNAAGVLFTTAVDASSADVKAVAIVREAAVKSGALVYPAGATQTQKDAALAQLAALQFQVRSSS